MILNDKYPNNGELTEEIVCLYVLQQRVDVDRELDDALVLGFEIGVVITHDERLDRLLIRQGKGVGYRAYIVPNDLGYGINLESPSGLRIPL